MGRCLWLVVVIISELVIPRTMPPILLALLLSVPFGMDDWRTGLWLWRTDPSRARGQACAGFSFAKSAARILFATLGLLVLFNTRESLITPPNPQPEPAVAAGYQDLLTLALIASPAVVVLTLASSLIALRNRVSVWLDPTLHTTRESGLWPPAQFGPTNHAQTPWLSAVSVSLIVLVTSVIVLLFPDRHEMISPHEQVKSVWAITICVMNLGMLWGTARHTLAKTPDDCWFPDPPPVSVDPATIPTRASAAAD